MGRHGPEDLRLEVRIASFLHLVYQVPHVLQAPKGKKFTLGRDDRMVHCYQGSYDQSPKDGAVSIRAKSYRE